VTRRAIPCLLRAIKNVLIEVAAFPDAVKELPELE
jgi:hypothetical protein